MTAPPHLAIAGAWGYIGRHFVDAARTLGWQLSVYDPAPVPDGIDLDGVHVCESAEGLYGLDADLFHLALHPEHRQGALDALLPRDGVAVLNEKPMASPERRADCDVLVDRIAGAGKDTVLVFDFPELFDPLTTRILDFLDSFEQVRLDTIEIARSKDREARNNPRNRKRMVTIQYQETVHCLAFALAVLGRIGGAPEMAVDGGVEMTADADPYDPPNPEEYPFVVDGRVRFDIRLGPASVRGHTDFKAGAPLRKHRTLRGVGDGRPFTIEVDYLEGAKGLVIDGVDQAMDPEGSSYEAVLTGMMDRLRGERDAIMQGCTPPNPRFTRLTYCLSSMLWRSAHEGTTQKVADTVDLLGYDAGFDPSSLPRYA